MADQLVPFEIVNKLLQKSKINSRVSDVVKLHGDASYRTYYRVILEDKQSLVLMQLPQGKASASEEITNFKSDRHELPFINIGRYLKNCGVRVPQIYNYSEEEKLILIEDLGDKLMAGFVENPDENIRREWYRKAIDLLVLIQERTSESESSETFALQRSFDKTLLNWEFDHFLEYGIEARLGVKPEKKDLDVFYDQTRKISDEIEKFPYGFTHRDFQSRNLLSVGDKLAVIDFQDALLGPAAYDLVSLLRDSYVNLSPSFLEDMIKHYCLGKKCDPKIFRYEFDLVTCQRKLKDAGRFVYIDRIKGNSSYLKYIPTTLGYVKSAIERLPKYTGLYDMLKKYVPEWSVDRRSSIVVCDRRPTTDNRLTDTLHSINKGMILAAGLGTRLRPLTNTVPKPLLPLDSKCLIDFPLMLLVQGGIKEIIINLHHLGDKIREYLGDGKRYGIKINYSYEPVILGTGGGIKNVEGFFEGKPFVCINTDSLIDIDIKEVIAKYFEANASALMVLKKISPNEGYEKISINKEGFVTKIGCGKDYFYTGVQVIGPDFLKILPKPGTFSCLIKDGYQKLISDGKKVAAYVYEGYFNDVGTFDRYGQAKKDLAGLSFLRKQESSVIKCSGSPLSRG